MGLVLGLALMTGFGALALAWLLATEARCLRRRFGRKYAALFCALLAAACVAYALGALAVAASVMEYGGLFDLFRPDF